MTPPTEAKLANGSNMLAAGCCGAAAAGASSNDSKSITGAGAWAGARVAIIPPAGAPGARAAADAAGACHVGSRAFGRGLLEGAAAAPSTCPSLRKGTLSNIRSYLTTPGFVLISMMTLSGISLVRANEKFQSRA